MTNLSLWIGLIGSGVGIVSALCGGVVWYRSWVRQKYAQERDFNHLKRYYESLAEAFKFQTQEFEEQFERLSRELDLRADRLDQQVGEIKSLLLADIRYRSREKD